MLANRLSEDANTRVCLIEAGHRGQNGRQFGWGHGFSITAGRIPGPGLKSGPALTQWVRENASTIFRPVGTCRMGTDDGSVVDPDLRVRGIDAPRR